MTISMTDAHQLYTENIVEHKGELYIVTDFGVNDKDAPTLCLRNLLTGRSMWVDADPEQVCCPSKYRLGYIQLNMETNAVYLSRAPRRQYSLGWSRHNVPALPGFTSLTRSAKNFISCLNGEFPPFERCLEITERIGISVAFDKQFATRACGRYIQYRGEPAIRKLSSGNWETMPGFPSGILKIFNEIREKTE